MLRAPALDYRALQDNPHFSHFHSMIRTKNLFASAAFAAVLSLCLPANAAPTSGWGWGNNNNNCGNNGGGGYGGNNNGCGNNNNNNHHHGNGHGCHNNNHHNGHHNGNGPCNNGGLQCDAGGPYTVECAAGLLTVELDATDSAGATTFAWSTNYPGAVFEDAAAAITDITFPASGCCDSSFYVTLVVGDGQRTKTCTAVIKVVDTTPPVIECPPLAKLICGDREKPEVTGTATATDNCDATPKITYSDVKTFPDCPAGRFDYTIERTWKAKDNCGNRATCSQTIHVVKVPVSIDALPGTCPNVVTPGGCEPVKIAILGTANFNVNRIIPSTVRLYGDECEGGPVFPQCAYPADVGTPFFGNLLNCDCSDANGDGVLDLVFTFKRSQVVCSLGLDDLPTGAKKPIVLIGKLCDGCRFIGLDCLQVP